jgi:tripartite-type tricarboxylate transporter receptor subunit TctC
VPNHLKTNYSLDQLRGVIRVNREHMVIVTKAGSGLKSADDIVAAAKADPGSLTFGSSGPASILHSAFLVFAKQAGIEMTHVPFQGGAPALAALLGGHIDMTILTPGDAKAQAEAGNVNLIATTSDRAPQLPDLASLSELGYDVNVENMKGLVVQADTPDEVVQYLHDKFKDAMESETFSSLAKRANIQPSYLNGADFDAAMQNMSKAIKEALSE